MSGTRAASSGGAGASASASVGSSAKATASRTGSAVAASGTNAAGRIVRWHVGAAGGLAGVLGLVAAVL